MIFQGYGIVVFVILPICYIPIAYLVYRDLGEAYYHSHSWPMALGFIFSGIICLFIGKQLHKESQKIVTNEVTREKVKFDIRHTVCFLKVEYWGILYVFIGICFLIFGITPDEI